MKGRNKPFSLNALALVMLIFTAMAIGLSPVQALAGDKPTVWKCQTAVSASSWAFNNQVADVAKRIEKETGGRLVIEMYPSGAVLPSKEIFPALKRNIVQMGFVTPGYWKTDISLARCTALPYAFLRNWEVIYFFKDLGFEKMLKDQILEHGVLYWSAKALPVAIVCKEPIPTFDSFKGKKVRSYGIYGKFFKAAGAGSAYAPGPEIYTGLATGVFDAAHWGAVVGANNLGLFEVCKYVMSPSISLGTEEGWFVNRKAFNKLPDDVKKIVTRILDEEFYSNTFKYAYAEQHTLGIVQKKHGVKVVTLSVEDQKRMSQAAMKVWDEVAAESEANAKAVDMLKKFLKDIGRL